jgi:hypothetical protein
VKDNTKTITWTKTGSQDANVKIRLYDSTGTTKILDITNSTANNGEFSWLIPSSLADGNYIVRVKTVDNAVWDDSPIFKITSNLNFEIPVTMYVMRDFVIKDIFYVFNYGGQLAVRLECLTSRFSGELKFRLRYRLHGHNVTKIITKRVVIQPGLVKTVLLQPFASNRVPFDGMNVSVMVDPDNDIKETNERNNRMSKRIKLLDISCRAPRSDLRLSRLYMMGGKDYRVKFKIRIEHNSVKTLLNLKVRWKMFHIGHGQMRTGGVVTFASVGPGTEAVKQINKTYGKEGRRNADFPRLKKGETYRIEVIFEKELSSVADTNLRNNVANFSFKLNK